MTSTKIQFDPMLVEGLQSSNLQSLIFQSAIFQSRPNQTRSKITAYPCPTPIHMVANA